MGESALCAKRSDASRKGGSGVFRVFFSGVSGRVTSRGLQVRSGDVVDRHVAPGALDQAEIGAVDAALVRALPGSGRAQLAHVGARRPSSLSRLRFRFAALVLGLDHLLEPMGEAVIVVACHRVAHFLKR